MTSTTLRTGAYLIRPGRSEDSDQVAGLVRERAMWMRDHGQDRWVTWDRTADSLASRVGEMQVAIDGCGDLVGITTADYETPSLGWTEQERAEPAVFLESTVTHPRLAGSGVGIVIAFWALDHAARTGRQWVRRGVLTIGRTNLGLVHYYRLQGWRVVRAVPHPRKPSVAVWSLQRPAARQPELATVLRDHD